MQSVTLHLLLSCSCLGALLVRPARAQLRLQAGPQLGGELTTVRFDQDQQFQTRWRPGLAAGVVAELRLCHWALQPALRYAQRGYRLAFTIPGDAATSTLYYRDQTRLHYLTLALPLAYHLRASSEPGWQVLAGPYVGWLLGGRYESETAFDPANSGGPDGLTFYPVSGPVAAERGYDPFDRHTAHLKGVDAGMLAGVGYQRRPLLVQVTYAWGLRDIQYRNFAANVGFGSASIPYYTRAATLSLTYLLATHQ